MTKEEIESFESQRSQLLRACVPEAFHRWLLHPHELTRSPALEAVQNFLACDLLSLVLGGSVGSGKTIAACWAITQHRGVRHPYMHEPGDMPPDYFWKGSTFVPLADFQNRSLWDEEDADFRARVAATTLLVLDDVGSERGDGAAAVQSLISSRMAEGRRTILTTNLTGEAFKARYGARVLDRIRERGHFINTGSVSLRKPA